MNLTRPQLGTLGLQVWGQVYRLYWIAAFGLGLLGFTLELRWGSPPLWQTGALYLISVPLVYGALRRWPKAAIGVHLLFGFLTSLYLLYMPAGQVFPGQAPPLLAAEVLPAFLALGLYAQAALAGWVWGVSGLLLLLILFPEPDPSARILLGLAFLLSLSAGVSVHVLLSRLELQSRRLHEVAHTDSLTGLLNRRALLEHYPRYQGLADRQGQGLLLSLWDLDGLKKANDLYGHEAGDGMIRCFAQVLQGAVRHGDALFRTGGDEFCGLHLVESEEEQAARALLERVRQSYPNVSGGLIPVRGLGLDEALRRADEAMYRDKQSRKARS
jgi:diguanylate cyclase (GGDEF)-like protein